MLATWLVELYLSKMDDLDSLISSALAPACPNNDPAIMDEAIHNDAATIYRFKEQQEEIMDEFRLFLNSSRDYLHSPTTFRLLASHGRHDAWLFYATLIGDDTKVIDYWLKENKWEKALGVLGKQVPEYKGNRLHTHIFSLDKSRAVLSILIDSDGTYTL